MNDQLFTIAEKLNMTEQQAIAFIMGLGKLTPSELLYLQDNIVGALKQKLNNVSK